MKSREKPPKENNNAWQLETWYITQVLPVNYTCVSAEGVGGTGGGKDLPKEIEKRPMYQDGLTQCTFFSIYYHLKDTFPSSFFPTVIQFICSFVKINLDPKFIIINKSVRVIFRTQIYFNLEFFSYLNSQNKGERLSRDLWHLLRIAWYVNINVYHMIWYIDIYCCKCKIYIFYLIKMLDC